MGVVVSHGGQTQWLARREFLKPATRNHSATRRVFPAIEFGAVKPCLHGLRGTFQNLADLGVKKLLVLGKANVTVTMRAVETERGCPIAGHIGFHLRPVFSGGAGWLNCCALVHNHAGHVHVEVELDRADIHEFAAACVAKLDDLIENLPQVQPKTKRPPDESTRPSRTRSNPDRLGK